MTFDPVCWGHVCDFTQGSLCPSQMKMHESMWIQWSFLFSKNLNQRSLTPRSLWPHICWGHMCDSTQWVGLLCRSPMGIHQCMWIQWSILQNFNQDYHILPVNHSLLLNKVQARPKIPWPWHSHQNITSLARLNITLCVCFFFFFLFCFCLFVFVFVFVLFLNFCFECCQINHCPPKL